MDNFSLHTIQLLLLMAAGIALVAIIFVLVIKLAKKSKAKKLPGIKLNNLHDEKSPLSIPSDKEQVDEKKYIRKIPFKKHKLLKRMYNDSRKRCRGKK